MAINGITKQSPYLGSAPPLSQLNNHFILDDMITNLGQFNPFHPAVDIDILVEWLKNVQNHQVDLESTMRKLLKTFLKTEAFKERFDPLDADIKAKIKTFIDGKGVESIVSKTGFKPKPSPSSQHRFNGLDYRSTDVAKPAEQPKPGKNSFWTKFQNLIGCMVQKVEDDDKDSALNVPDHLGARNKLFSKRWGGEGKVVWDDAEKTKVMEVCTLIFSFLKENTGANSVQVYENIPFDNWGLVQEAKNTPALTCVPTKVQGLINLINWVNQHHPDLRVRCAGYRHSWAPVFSEDKQILVSMLNLEQATQLPDPSVISATSRENACNDFKVIGPVVVAAAVNSATIRLGAAVTTEEFRRWATTDGKWCLPMDVILGEYEDLLPS